MYIYVYIFFPYIFSETQRNKKNAVQTTKFGVVPLRKVPYVHVSHCHYSRKLNDIYTQNYAKIMIHISILRKSKKNMDFIGLTILFWPLNRDNHYRRSNHACIFV